MRKREQEIFLRERKREAGTDESRSRRTLLLISTIECIQAIR
jgi:hypothetical protein